MPSIKGQYLRATCQYVKLISSVKNEQCFLDLLVALIYNMKEI
jgi:hypothetical protein